jgi:hypothetical protein
MYVVDSLRYMYSIPKSSGNIDIRDIIDTLNHSMNVKAYEVISSLGH